MNTKTKLIKMEFPEATFQDFKNLTPEDKAQLASAIARLNNIPQSACDFEFVEY